MTMTPKAQDFAERTTKLAGFVTTDHKFCCEKHQKVFFDIQEKAEKFVASLKDDRIKASFSQDQLDYARAIIVGSVRHGGSTGSDPERVVTAKCVQRIEGTYTDKDGVEQPGLVPCGVEFTGTAKEVGGWKTKCEGHRS